MANTNNQDPTGIRTAFAGLASAIAAQVSGKENSWWDKSQLSPMDDEFPLDVPAALDYKLKKYMSAEYCNLDKVAKWITLSFDYFNPEFFSEHPIKDTLVKAIDFLRNYDMMVQPGKNKNGETQIYAQSSRDGKWYASRYKYPVQKTTLFIDGIAEEFFEDRVKAKAVLFKKLAEYANLGLNIAQSKKECFAFKILKPNGEKISIKIV